MKVNRLFAVCCAILLIVPLAVNSQQPGGDNGGGGRGGRGGRGGGGGGPGGGGFGGGGRGGVMGGGRGDPSRFFDMLSNGKDVIRIDQLDEGRKAMVTGMAARFGVTISNNQITRDQFSAGIATMQAQRAQGAPGAGTSGGRPEMTPEEMDRRAEDSFRKSDKDGDGQLQYTEMPENLRTTLDKYDANRDGSINLDEYKAYYRDRIQLRMQENAAARAQNPNQAPEADGLAPVTETEPVQDDDKKPTVYRYGKMPKEIPPWFTELDTYKDGQIWFSSWLKAGRSAEEFRAMDRNDDGLLTPDEVLSYVRANTKQSPGDTVVASANGDDRTFGGRPGFGGLAAACKDLAAVADAAVSAAAIHPRRAAWAALAAIVAGRMRPRAARADLAATVAGRMRPQAAWADLAVVAAAAQAVPRKPILANGGGFGRGGMQGGGRGGRGGRGGGGGGADGQGGGRGGRGSGAAERRAAATMAAGTPRPTWAMLRNNGSTSDEPRPIRPGFVFAHSINSTFSSP